MKKVLFYIFSFIFLGYLHKVYADTNNYRDQLSARKPFQVSKETINDPDIQKRIAYDFSQTYPPIEQLTSYSSHQSKWSLNILKLKISSTGTIGAHAGWAYNQYSFEKMSKILSPKDVPGLLELFSTENSSTTGIEFSIASQCRAGLEELLMSVHNKAFHKLNGRMIEISTATSIITNISKSSVCDKQTKQDALKVLTSIDNFNMPQVKYYLQVNYTNDGLKTINNFQGDPGGYIACYSHYKEGSAYAVGENIYVMGRIRVKGHYKDKIFQPFDEQKDIDKDHASKNLCNHYFPYCHLIGCWAVYDTGSWFGL